MKSESEIILRCKQPINREAIFVLPLSHCVGERQYCFDSFVASFFSFYFLNALQSDNDSKTVYVLGHKYILGASQRSF